MKNIISLIGILLIIFGIVTLAYKGITYTTREKVAEIGDLQLTAEKQKTVYFPEALGILSIGAGIVLVVVGRKK